MVYNRALEVLEEKDRLLPAIVAMREIVKKGVGIHHGGLLPLIKEVVELLFQDGLLKVLFSTETFSMGLNMPARTVVFTNIKKFDGEKSRWLTGG
jgi:ATP-dependent RNA helicase DOB1